MAKGATENVRVMPGATRPRVKVMCSGRPVDLGAPHASMFQMRDLAEHLAKQGMFDGGTRQFYSRAQHGVIVAETMLGLEGAMGALYGLLESAHFAVGETDPLTAANVSKAIHEALDMDWPAPASITKALTQVLARVELAEISHLRQGCDHRADQLRQQGVIPLRSLIRPLPWDRALDRWLACLTTNAVAANLPHMPAFGDLL